MSRFLLTIEGKQLQKRSVEKLVRSLKDLKKKGEIDITVKEDNPPTSRAARLEAALSQVTDAASEVGELRDELQEWYDNLPEQFQDGVLIIAATVLGNTLIKSVLSKPTVQGPARVDTLLIMTTVYSHDSITVISRAADTVRIRIKEVGPLTERDLVRLICTGAADGGQNPRLKLRGGKYDHFEFAPAGVVYCPEQSDEP